MTIVGSARVKTWKPKTRTGCRTCRSRRIKCDETRPVCKKCSSGGRTCGGYEVAVPRADGSSLPLLPRTSQKELALQNHTSPSLPFKLEDIELSAFDCFRQHVVRLLSGHFSSDIWRHVVLQRCHVEPAILHGTIAVGAMFQFRHGSAQSLYRPTSTTGFQEDKEQVALKHYTKAITSLRTTIESKATLERADVTQMTLIACLLFLCFEMLQDDQEQALAHLVRGLKILGEHSASPQVIKGKRRRIIGLSNVSSTIVDGLTDVFVRLDFDSTRYSRRSPYLYPACDGKWLDRNLDLPHAFASTFEAKKHLDTLSSAVFRLRGDILKLADDAYPDELHECRDWQRYYCILQARARRLNLDGDKVFNRRKEELLKALAKWKSNLHSLKDVWDRPAVNQMENQHFYPWFVLNTWHAGGERLCDNFEDDFRRVIEVTDQYTSTANHKFQDYGFVLEPGVLASLYFIGIKCRDSVLRRKVIGILRRATIQEGLWSGRTLATYVEKFMEIEEQRARDLSGILAIEGDLKAEDVPEEARFCEVVRTRAAGEGRLVCARYADEKDGELEVEEYRFALLT